MVELNHAEGERWAKAELTKLLTNHSTVADPFPLLKWLRENDPVPEGNGLCLATRFDDVVALFRDKRLSRQKAAIAETAAHSPEGDDEILHQAEQAWIAMMINQDEPGHMRIRRILDEAFRPERVLQWRSRVEAITAELIDRVRDKDEFDLLKELGYPLPETVICELMGVPLADHALWGAWTEAVINAGRTATPTPAQIANVSAAIKNFYLYLRDLVAERRANLGDDLVSVLIRAADEGGGLSELELSGTLQMLIQAGHETTANLIGNGMFELLKHPDQYERLRQDPGLVPSAVEEMLRYASPSHWSQARVATEDIRIGGETIPSGCPVMMAINSANRDPAVFEEPEKFDIGRTRNRHVAFAAGAHFCLGSMLARQEAQAMFEAIVTRLPKLELAEQPELKTTFVRALKSLRVRRAAG